MSDLEGYPLTRDELLASLRAHARENTDPEVAHVDADELLLAYIDDDEVTLAFEAIRKWYA